MEWEDVPSFPDLVLPEAPLLPDAVLEVPRASLPSYKPLVAPPSTLRPPIGIEPIGVQDKPPTTKTKIPLSTPYVPPEAQIIEVPFTDIEIPMPTTTIMTTAATTAFISVAATLLGQSLFKYLVTLFKPIIKQIWSKLTKKKTVENQKTS
jgi:hypothetical protein